MSTTLRIAPLADHPETLPTLKEWFETEWESYYGPNGPGDAEKDLVSYMNRGELPVALVAFIRDELCGIAALTAASLTTHAHLSPWAAAGLVNPPHRRKGIGAHLLSALEEVARTFGYAHIYCGTSTAMRLLHRAGWQFMERVSYHGDEVSIYHKGLSPGAAAVRGAAPCGGEMMETSPLTLVSITRPREDGTYGTLDPVEADSLSEDLRVRCVAAIERYRAEHGTAPNPLVIETTGQVIATSQTG